METERHDIAEDAKPQAATTTCPLRTTSRAHTAGGFVPQAKSRHRGAMPAKRTRLSMANGCDTLDSRFTRQYINTLMIQRVLADPQWSERLLPEDLRALTPLIYGHVTPYGEFHLDLGTRLDVGPIQRAG